MKCKYLIVIIGMFFICLGGQVIARYILNKNLDINIETASFYFEVETENTEIGMINNQAEIRVKIKNNDGENYNLYDANYEIVLLNDEKFSFSLDGQVVENNIVYQTINGNSLIDDEIKIIFQPKANVELNTKENIELKIISISPYKKEINLSIKIITDGSPRIFDGARNIGKSIYDRIYRRSRKIC